MELTFLGTGTSVGVPVIGCSCEVCRSDSPRNNRLRPSVMIKDGKSTVVIDIGPDFRQQALRAGISSLNAVLLTHAHADHIMGLDELRMFNYYQKENIPVFGSIETLEQVRRTFWYAFEETQQGGGKPELDLRAVDGPFSAAGTDFIPVPVVHGKMEVFGFRFGDIAYLTDCSFIPESSYRLLEGLDILVLGALRFSHHPTHMTVGQALAESCRIGARRTLLTHMNHDLDYRELDDRLPCNINMAYDGLVI